jgi:prephenate dehydrogenase
VSGPLFERLAVIGLGLLGGSVALGARERGLARAVRGVDPKLREAAPIPLVPIEEAARWADAVVIAVPVEAVEEVARRLGPLLSPEALVTDTVSVKLPVARAAHRYLRPERCVGAHPMAGGDLSGFTYARPDLFERAPCILALSGQEPDEVVDRIDRFWQGLGARTVRKTPEEHDAITAVLSHAPHAIAFAFARGLPDEETLRLSGAGLRDFVRIARSNPELWCEILLNNRSRVAEEIARFEKNLGAVVEALGRADRDALLGALRAGRAAAGKLER